MRAGSQMTNTAQAQASLFDRHSVAGSGSPSVFPYAASLRPELPDIFLRLCMKSSSAVGVHCIRMAPRALTASRSIKKTQYREFVGVQVKEMAVSPYNLSVPLHS